MASGQELATAYLSLTVSARGINKDIQREMSGAEGIAESSGRRMGSKLADGIKTGAKVAGVAFTALLGTALTKGFGRLSAIENAQASLSGLGNSAEDVASIMKNALASVKGTAFGMDEAASTAAGAVAAGIKPGKDLEAVLRLVGDAATIGGSSMGEMGAIFNKVATSNKVQGDVIAQLNDRGIPIVQMLGKQLGVTSEEVTKMASEGEIGFETFRAAMEDGLGGAALKSGETTKGAFKNMMAALSRIGAGLLGGVFPYFKTVFGGITGLLDGIEGKLTPLANGFGKELAGGIMAFTAAWKANDGDITSSGFAGVMERIAYVGRQGFDELTGSVKAFRAAWVYNDGEITSSGLPGFMERVGYIARQTFDGLRDLLSRLRPSFEQLGPPILALLVALSPAQLLFNSLLPVLPNVAALLGSLAATAAELGTVLAGALAVALAGLLPVIIDIVDWAAGLISAMTDSQAKIDILTGVVLAGTGAFLAFKTGVLVTATVTKGYAVATKAAAVGQRILNVAMKANPIGILITAVTGLVAGLVWFFTKTETGQKIVTKAWGVIKSAVGGVVDWFKSSVMPAFNAVWGGITSGVRGVVNFFQNTVLPIVRSVFTAVGAVFSWLYDSIIKPVFSAISTVVGGFYTLARGIFQLVVSVIVNVLAPAFRAFWNATIKPVFNAIGSLFSRWWTGAKVIFNAVVSFLRDTIGVAFQRFWFTIQQVFHNIQNHIKRIWYGNIKPVFDVVVGFLRDTIGVAFQRLWWTVQQVFHNIQNHIKRVWYENIKPVFDTLASFIQESIPKAFDKGVSAVKTAWDKLKGIAKAPVKFVVDTVINNGLIAAFNKIAGSLPGIDKLPNVALPPGFANGGYTGDGGKYQPAGIVHAGEYVFTKEETRKAGVSNLSRLAQTLRGYATGGLVHPIPGFGINSGFGRGGTDPSHTGADFAAPTGTPVRAAGPGIVSQAAWSNYGGGNEVKVNHPNGLQTWYSHLSSIIARLGQSVTSGQLVGRVGSTGNSTGPHLHYTVMRDGQYVDPAGYLAGGGASGTSGSGGAAPSNPLEGVIGGLVSKFKAQFPGGGMFADMAIGAGQKIFTDAKNWVTDKLNGVKEAVTDSVKSAVSGIGRFVGLGSAGSPTVYDGGGWLEKTGRPQLVQHNKSKPDAVLSNEQWGTMTRIAENSGAAVGGVTIHGDVYGATPEQIVNEWDTKQRRAATMHNLRKVMVG